MPTPPARDMPTKLRNWAIREYFRQMILARYAGDEHAAWMHVITSLIRGRRIKERGVTRTVGWAEDRETCYDIAVKASEGEVQLCV